MIFSFSYHDPAGKYDQLIKSTIDLLLNTFESICVGATPATVSKNKAMLNFLSEKGCFIFENEENTNIGDHYRNALKIATDFPGRNDIFFGFIDRVLFALNTQYKSDFFNSINQKFEDLVLFERSDLAWSTHPDNYRQIEQLTNKLGAFLLGKELELATCGFLIKSDLAIRLLANSTEKTFSAGAEWIILSYLLGITPKTQKVDWLSWEDPFIEGIDPVTLKTQKENDKMEVIKRLEGNLPFTNLFTQKRFYPILGVSEQ
jgi:hypothetical protein